MQELPLMRKTGGDDEDVKQAKPPAPAPGTVVTSCVTLPDGSVCDVDISVRHYTRLRRTVTLPAYDTRYYFNVRSKADISQLNLPHGMRSAEPGLCRPNGPASVRLSVPSVDSSSGVRLVCCWAPRRQVISIDSRRRRSAANAGSVVLAAEGRGCQHRLVTPAFDDFLRERNASVPRTLVEIGTVCTFSSLSILFPFSFRRRAQGRM